ncbi:MAG: hypothetical protein WBB23_22965 [Desulforhopalus sp.]
MNKNQIEVLLIEQGRELSSRMRIVDDTSDFMVLNSGDIMVLNYLVCESYT